MLNDYEKAVKDLAYAAMRSTGCTKYENGKFMLKERYQKEINLLYELARKSDLFGSCEKRCPTVISLTRQLNEAREKSSN